MRRVADDTHHVSRTVCRIDEEWGSAQASAWNGDTFALVIYTARLVQTVIAR
jgi:hypothetical protein